MLAGDPKRMKAAPGPGEADLPAENVGALLSANANGISGGQPAIHFGDEVWTHSELYAEALRWSAMFAKFLNERERSPGGGGTDPRPLHVGVLLDNTPDYLFALAGAGVFGATVVGLNHTRTDSSMFRDLAHTDVDLLITEPRHAQQLRDALQAGAMLSAGVPVVVSQRHDGFSDAPLESLPDTAQPWLDLDAELDSAGEHQWAAGESALSADTRWALIFTSGTSSDPKAVVCSQKRLLTTGNRMRIMLDLKPDDVGYICMPLFHSNALMVGWAPSLVTGCSVALARRFSASGWLPDVRRFGATYFNYTGKPLSYVLATPEQSDDSDNAVRVAFGNEGSPEVLEKFGQRFGVNVVDAFGSTEGAIAVSRDQPPRHGAVGVAGPTVRVVREDGTPCSPAVFNESGVLSNSEDAVGEIVNTAGGGPFEGYYNNTEATKATLRDGWYWSGDLGYLDEDRYLFFAGRTADWLRVDGENFPAGPIEDALIKHPGVIAAATYGVPDVHSGDQVMASVVPAAGAFSVDSFGEWLDTESGLPTKWVPTYLRVASALPTTGTNKVVKRRLVRDKYRPDLCGTDSLYARPPGTSNFEPFTAKLAQDLRAQLSAAGRERFWDL